MTKPKLQQQAEKKAKLQLRNPSYKKTKNNLLKGKRQFVFNLDFNYFTSTYQLGS